MSRSPTFQGVRAVAIDLDGTLLDTVGDVAEATNRTLQELGLQRLPERTIRGFIGKGMMNLIACALAASQSAAEAPVAPISPARVASLFERHYLACLTLTTQAYPGVVAGLSALRDLQMPLAVVTNKNARFTLPLLAQTGLADFFRVVVAGDTTAHKKPHAAPLQWAARELGVPTAQLLMVGDSANDVQAARNAGCPVVVVPYGYTEGLAVENLGADQIVHSLQALAGLLAAR